MRAHHIMTKDLVAVTPHTTIGEAAKIMLQMHISGLPVVDDAGNLVGVVSESDFLRRSEIGTGRRHAEWLKFFMGPGRAAAEFVHERGRKVADVMTRNPRSVGPDDLAIDCVDAMEAAPKVSQLVVVDAHGRLVGALHLHDLFKAKIV